MPRSLDEMPPQSAYSELSGIELISVTSKEVVCQLLVTNKLANRNGMLHGGAVMTLADDAAGTLAFINIPAGKTNTTIESKTNFMRGVRLGDTVTARCKLLHRGRTMLVMQTEMTREDGQIAAVSMQTHLILEWSDERKK